MDVVESLELRSATHCQLEFRRQSCAIDRLPRAMPRVSDGR